MMLLEAVPHKKVQKKAYLQARLRGHRVEAPGAPVSIRSKQGLAQNQESERAGRAAVQGRRTMTRRETTDMIASGLTIPRAGATVLPRRTLSGRGIV
jgi:hypothetical protein